MTLDQILATDRKIAYVDNTGGSISGNKALHAAVMECVFADSTELPEEIADLLVLSFVQLGDERRAILNWA